MWRGWEEALIAYGVAVCDEWRRRGHRDTVRETLIAEFGRSPRTQVQLNKAHRLPPWLGKEAFHQSHRRALLAKDEAYREIFGDVPDGSGYVWPGAGRAGARVAGPRGERAAAGRQGKKKASHRDV